VRELREVVRAFRALGPGEAAVLASVVGARGSTYRRPGARVLFLPDGAHVGLVSGGCLEGDLAVRAAAVRESGRPALARYDGTRDADLVWGLGLGCAGVVELLLERVSPDAPGPLGALGAWLDSREPGVLVTGVGAGEAALGWRAALAPDGGFDAGGWGARFASQAEQAARRALAERRTRRVRLEAAGESAEALAEFVRPVPRLVVFGAGPDAPAVVRAAKQLGWAVAVVDERAAFARPERFPDADRVVRAEPAAAAAQLALDPGTLALAMTHHYLRDREILGVLLASPVPYVGVLGPRRRTEDLLADLRARAEDLERVHAPAGLDLGAEAPEEIALSVVSEMQAFLAGRAGGALRARKGPIHDPFE
jgi:xanthine/CO dehydrogenase XdhC/CoxF family maturation factor